MFTALSRQNSIFGFFVSLGANYPCDLSEIDDPILGFPKETAFLFSSTSTEKKTLIYSSHVSNDNTAHNSDHFFKGILSNCLFLFIFKLAN